MTRGTQIEMESEKPDAGAGRHKRQVRQDTGILVFLGTSGSRERGVIILLLRALSSCCSPPHTTATVVPTVHYLGVASVEARVPSV